MDGVLLIDKPGGITSHDVVARARRLCGQRDIGHTGTLDPAATGLLPLVLGRATRLASLLTSRSKTYEATICLGTSTDTDDADGRTTSASGSTLPDAGAIDDALEAFRGTFEQTPPTHSAKRVAGRKAYELARESQAVILAPVTVTVECLERLAHEGDLLELRLTVTSGFYVRALARDLGVRLGCGAHLRALRRTATGAFHVRDAVTLDAAERLGPALAARVISPAAALGDLAAVHVTELGQRRAIHGNFLNPEHLAEQRLTAPMPTGPVRVLAADGHLLALAEVRAGVLHPVVVLG